MSSEPVSSHRMLRPLMPRPFTNNGSTFSTIPTHFCSLHNPKLPSWTQPLCDYGGGKRETIRGATTLVSSRWNPTAEQVQALEEMYRRGTRTPTAEQIQQIAAKLRRFGKIEGKNVFYWFQNHKARDRQKKRRQLELLTSKNINNDFPQRKHSGLSRNKYLEMEHPKTLPITSKCSTGSKYDGGEEEKCKKESWIKLELQQPRVTANTTETSCRPLDLLSLSMPRIIDHQKSSSLNLCKHLSSKNDDSGREFECGIEENRTLELFPARGNIDGVMSCSASTSNKEEMDEVSCAGTKLVPNQFFEFLPTKK